MAENWASYNWIKWIKKNIRFVQFCLSFDSTASRCPFDSMVLQWEDFLWQEQSIEIRIPSPLCFTLSVLLFDMYTFILLYCASPSCSPPSFIYVSHIQTFMCSKLIHPPSSIPPSSDILSTELALLLRSLGIASPAWFIILCSSSQHTGPHSSTPLPALMTRGISKPSPVGHHCTVCWGSKAAYCLLRWLEGQERCLIWGLLFVL